MVKGKVYAYITDNLGSVIAIVDTGGGADYTYAYDPYGVTANDSSRIGYTGALTDTGDNLSTGVAETGYVHLGQRSYNPQTGAFTAQGPQTVLANPADASTYPYATDNPANNTDPTGADWNLHQLLFYRWSPYTSNYCRNRTSAYWEGLFTTVAIAAGVYSWRRLCSRIRDHSLCALLLEEGLS